MTISIKTVDSKQRWRDFLSLPTRIYPQDSDYCLDLLSETRNELSDKNPIYKQCTVQCFIAYKDQTPYARAACIINPKLNTKIQKQVGLLAYLEFMDNEEALNALLAHCDQYFSQYNCIETWAGIRFSLNYPVGIQTSGFENQHTFLMNKQPAYYADFLSKQGFQSEKQLHAYCVDLYDQYRIPEILIKDANSAKEKGYRVRLMKKSDIEPCLLHYNKRWQNNFAHTELSKEELQHLIRNMKLYLDTRFCFVVEKDQQICGYLFTFPDFNHTLKQWKGKTSVLKLLRFLYQYKLKGNVQGLKTAIIGVDEAHTGQKLSSLMNKALLEAAKHYKCQYIERSWILEDNHASIKQAQRMGGALYKTYSVFARKTANARRYEMDEAV